MQLLKFELYKIVMQKSVWIAFIVFIGIALYEQDFPNGPMNSIFFDPMFTGTLLLIGLSSIFTREYSTGVDNYILSAKKGRRTLGWAKVGAALLYAFILVFVWEIFNLLLNFFRFGIEGWGDPIQALPPYADSPYELSMLEFHFFQMGIHLLGAFAFALWISLISSISKNALIAFVVNLFILFGPKLEFVDETWFGVMLPFIFFNSLLVQPLFVEFISADLFGYSIVYSVLAPLFMVGSSFIFIKLILQIMKHKEVTS